MAKGWFSDDCPEAAVRLENTGTRKHPRYQWVVKCCPYCGNEHRHNAGSSLGLVDGTLGSRMAHCAAGARFCEYVLVRREDGKRKPLSAGVRFHILARDGFHCVYCGRGPEDGVKLHIDHKIPVSRGGTDVENNLVTACADCNLGKGSLYDGEDQLTEVRPTHIHAERIVWPTRAERSEQSIEHTPDVKALPRRRTALTDREAHQALAILDGAE